MSAVSSPPTGSVGATMTVSDAQRRLTELGFDAGPADGVAGARTFRALRAFQVARRIRVTGQLDAAMIEQLAK